MYRKNDLILPANNKQTQKQPCRDSHISGLICGQVPGKFGGHGGPVCLRLPTGTQNVTSLVVKEPELNHKVERCWRDVVGFTSTQCSGTSLLDWGLDCVPVQSCPW